MEAKIIGSAVHTPQMLINEFIPWNDAIFNHLYIEYAVQDICGTVKPLKPSGYSTYQPL